MEKFNMSLDLQIAVKFRTNVVIACCLETKKVALFLHLNKKTVYAEIDRNNAIIGDCIECEIATNAGKIDDITGEIIPSENPMYHMVGTGTFNKTNVKKAYSMIRGK